MKNYTVKKFENEPIVLLAYTEETTVTDLGFLLEDVITEMDHAQEDRLFVIGDVLRATYDLDNVIQSANLASSGGKAMFRHPKMRELVVVTDSRLLSIASKGLNTPVFGNVPVHVVETMEEALAYIRSQS